MTDKRPVITKKSLALIPVLVVLVVLAYGLTLLKNRHNSAKQTDNSSPAASTMKTALYTNEEFGFSLQVPTHYSVKDVTPEMSGGPFKFVSFQRETKQQEWIVGAKSNHAAVFDIHPWILAEFAVLEKDCREKSREEMGPGCFPLDNVEGHKVIGRNNKYAFIYTRVDRITDYPNDFTPEMFAEAEEIIKSFKTFDVK